MPSLGLKIDPVQSISNYLTVTAHILPFVTPVGMDVKQCNSYRTPGLSQICLAWTSIFPSTPSNSHLISVESQPCCSVETFCFSHVKWYYTDGKTSHQLLKLLPSFKTSSCLSCDHDSLQLLATLPLTTSWGPTPLVCISKLSENVQKYWLNESREWTKGYQKDFWKSSSGAGQVRLQ